MKKALSGILSTAIVLSVLTATAFAAGPGCGRYFSDLDGDGICDLCGTEHRVCLIREGTAFVDADGDGICDNCGTYHWCGMAGAGFGGNFVDADGDGVCDNYGSGQGYGYGRGTRGGRGNGFRGGRGR